MADELVLPEDVSLMIVEDDRPFRTRLALTLRRKGFEVFFLTRLVNFVFL